MSTAIVPKLDHLVYASPNLAASVRDVGALLGVSPAPGGRHPMGGTENALIGLGTGRYLEIIGPDVAAPEFAGTRSFGIDALDEPRLVTWAIAVEDLDAVVARARAAGYDPGNPRNGSRLRSDGVLLRWRLALKQAPWDGDGLVPFLIQWGADTEHPSVGLGQDCELVALRAVHPVPEIALRTLRALDVSLDVASGREARLIAEIRSPVRTTLLS